MLCSRALLVCLPSEGHLFWGGKLLRSPCWKDHLGYSPTMLMGWGYFCQNWRFRALLMHLHGKT